MLTQLHHALALTSLRAWLKSTELPLPPRRKKLEGVQGMAVTFEPEQTTETAGQPETNNDALNTTGEDELEQLLEEFFEDEGKPAKTRTLLKPMGEGFLKVVVSSTQRRYLMLK